MTLKSTVRRVAAAAVVVALGGTAGWYVRSFLLGSMINMQWWRRVRDWLFGRGHEELAVLWTNSAMALPGWLIAVVLGGAIGLAVPGSWFWLAGLCGVALAAAPNIVLFAHGLNPFQIYDWSTAAYCFAWDLTELPILLMAASFARRWRRPFPEGCCRVCGYDLTGNMSGICPECGSQVRRRSGQRGDP